MAIFFILYDIKNKKWKLGRKSFIPNNELKETKDGYIIGKRTKIFFFKNEKNLDKLTENYKNIKFVK